jgi:hypothetical protein
MSRFPTGSIWLRFEPPFFLEEALKNCGFDSKHIEVSLFDDDEIATQVNASLRRSIEQYLENSDRSSHA